MNITENSALGHSTMTISGGHPISIRTSRFSLAGRTRYPGPPDPCCVPHVLGLPRDLSLEATAFHEAGHALVALLFRMHVSEVFIAVEDRPRPCPGPVIYDAWGANRDTDYGGRDATSVLTMLAAGERAQMQWLRQRDLWTEARAWATEAGALGDQDTARYVLEANGLPILYGTGQLLGFPIADYWIAGGSAEAILIENWSTVGQMADGLLTRKRLTGDEIAALAGFANPPRVQRATTDNREQPGASG